MGGGFWTRDNFERYSGAMGRKVDARGGVVGDYKAQDLFKARNLDKALDPYKVMRECCDSAEHPDTLPVIFALDVTGSMGQAAVEVAKKLNIIMTDLYGQVKDVEFMVMGIGDLAYDRCPIQITQFESDIRIAEQLDKVFFEFGGGGNYYESYTAAWYMALNHTKIDCEKRGRKPIIITMGDERLNPYLPKNELARATGDKLQGNVETKELYKEAAQRFDIYHLNVDHRSGYDAANIEISFKEFLDGEHFKTVTIDDIAETVTRIVVNAANHTYSIGSLPKAVGISW